MADMTLVSFDGKRTTSLTGLEGTVTRKIVKFMVQKQISCPVNGQILDMRTVVALIDPNGNDVRAIMSPDGYRARSEAVAARFPNLLVWHRPF